MSDWYMLRLWAESYEDIVKARISITNRISRAGIDEQPFKYELESIELAEADIKKALRRCYRTVVPVGVRNWQKESTGIGEHLMARLLGVIGHPVHAEPHHWEPNPDFDTNKPSGENNRKKILVSDPPFDRTVSQLWAYCGHGDPTRKRRQGMTQDDALLLGNPRAKTLVYLLAESCMKNGKATDSYYRQVYDRARKVYNEKVSTDDDKWPDARRHNAALRKVGKEILKDLWLAARD